MLARVFWKKIWFLFARVDKILPKRNVYKSKWIFSRTLVKLVYRGWNTMNERRKWNEVTTVMMAMRMLILWCHILDNTFGVKFKSYIEWAREAYIDARTHARTQIHGKFKYQMSLHSLKSNLKWGSKWILCFNLF